MMNDTILPLKYGFGCDKMTGILVINHFLKGEKFDLLHRHLARSAAAQGIELKIKTNLEMRTETGLSADFILFWDKDVNLASALQHAGLPVFNSARSIALCDDKAKTYQALLGSVLQPETMVAPMTFFESSDFSPFIDAAVEKLGLPLVFKECYGSFGAQVFLCKTKEEIKSRITSRPFLLQKFIASSEGHDIRLEIVDGVCAAAMERSNPNDFRANITNGGSMKKYTPTQEEINIAVSAAEKLGLLFGGVDILDGGVLCEVNSNAHIMNIMDCTGVDIAPLIFKSIKEKIQ